MSLKSENNTFSTNVQNSYVFVKEENDSYEENAANSTIMEQNFSRPIKQEANVEIPAKVNVFSTDVIKQEPDNEEAVTVKIEKIPQGNSSLQWKVKEEQLEVGPYVITGNLRLPHSDQQPAEDVASKLEDKNEIKEIVQLKSKHSTSVGADTFNYSPLLLPKKKCSNPKYVQKDLKENVRIHTGEKLYSCDVCYRKFRKNVTLQRHLSKHSGEKPYSCDICKRHFSRNNHLKTHLRTHTGEKPYSCDICKRQFGFSSYYKRHLRTHTGEKPYSCDICKRQFSEKCNLRKHMKTHTGERPFSCNICKRDFNQKGQLKTHLRTHTGEKPYSCDVCQRKFTQSSNLKNHCKKHCS